MPEAVPPSDPTRPGEARASSNAPADAERLARRAYWLLSALLVLAMGNLFYGSLKLQTEHVALWNNPQAFEAAIRGVETARWSAPLDDVFIHFDFGRATARGYPFEWSEGNGYSSGGTSLLYPFVLALGYWVGYRGLALMVWAGIVASVSTFATLLSVEGMYRDLAKWTRQLAPCLFLSTGVLDWSLFSGMEVALFLAIWGLCFYTWDEIYRAFDGSGPRRVAFVALGLVCAVLVATRPEAALLVLVFGASLAWRAWQSQPPGQRRPWRIIEALLLVGVPAALVLGTHLVANRIFTGDSSAAGALAKLELHHPYLTRREVFDAWLFHIAYQVRRVAEYHLSAVPFLGYIVWLLGLLPLFFQKTRRYGVMLWVSVILWITTVALNGQVRWQNDRYTMPALAWLLMAVALGIAGAIDWAFDPLKRPTVRARWPLLGPVALVTLVFLTTELPRLREQIWFFGRASRNILEQHVGTGEYLRKSAHPRPHRVMVSDAGAIPYVSDLPAFDLIGLGGYEGLPIAKASRQGVGAAVELIEHLHERNRPDAFALYPSWWGTFLLWFGRPVHEFPVRGNVICGGASMVVYDPDWSALATSSVPFSVGKKERLVDSLDVADLLSERPHSFTMSRPSVGFVDMKILAHPREPDRDLWDAGRLLTPGLVFSFSLKGGGPGGSLLIRVAPAQNAKLSVAMDGVVNNLEVQAADHWQELRVPGSDVSGPHRIELGMIEGDLQIFHVFSLSSQVAEH